MKGLNGKYRQILWFNVILLGGGIGYMVYHKTGDIRAGLGVGAVLAIVEYFVMGRSLLVKQKREEEGNNP